MWEVFLSGTEYGHHVGHAATWIDGTIESLWVETELGTKEFDAFYLHHGENWRDMVDMDTSVENCNNVLGNLSDWIRATVELVIEEWMHGLDTVFEGSLDGLHALFDALTLPWNLAQGGNDLSWHGKVVDPGGVWLAALSVMLPDEWSDEREELVEIFLVLYELGTYWFLGGFL